MNNNNCNFDPITGQPIYNQQPNQNINNNQQKKENNNSKKILLIIAVVIAIIGIIGLLLLFTGKDNKTNKNGGNITIVTVGNLNSTNAMVTSAITKLYGNYVKPEEFNNSPQINTNGLLYNTLKVEYDTDSRHYVNYYLPTYKDYIKSLILGDIKPDGAILVVSANIGIMAETKKQLELINQVGVKKIVVYMPDCNTGADINYEDSVEEEIRETIEQYGFDRENTPIVRGETLNDFEKNSKEKKNIKKLMEKADEWLEVKESNNNVTPHTKFKAHIYLTTKDEGGNHTPIFNNYESQIKFNDSSANGTIEVSEEILMMLPGDDFNVNINLNETISFKQYDTFKIYKDDVMVGIGVVSEIIE